MAKEDFGFRGGRKKKGWGKTVTGRKGEGGGGTDQFLPEGREEDPPLLFLPGRGGGERGGRGGLNLFLQEGGRAREKKKKKSDTTKHSPGLYSTLYKCGGKREGGKILSKRTSIEERGRKGRKNPHIFSHESELSRNSEKRKGRGGGRFTASTAAKE